MNSRRHFIASGAGVAVALMTQGVCAQSNVTRLLLGYPAGTSIDNLGRLMAHHMKTALDTNIIVENKPGAAGRISMDLLKKSPADGAVFSIVPSPQMTLYPFVYPKLSYSPLDDFEPVSAIAKFAYVMMVGPGVPESVKTATDFAAWAKAQPKQPVMFSSNAQGSGGHFLGLSFAKRTGIQLSYVPYQGGADAVRSLIAGDLPMAILAAGAAMPKTRHPSLRLLAMSGEKRSSLLPDVPTFAESKLDGLVMEEWVGVLMPKGVDKKQLDKFATAVKQTVSKPEVVSLLNNIGLEPMGYGPAETTQLVKTELERMKPMVAESGFSFTD
jgi:tripartite-type tricarboxylate transporter receptor subunit TctC